MADRSVATTDTVETFRTTFNSLATDVGDIRANTSSESCFIVDNDINSMANGLKEITDPKSFDRNIISKKIKQKSWENVSKKLDDIYEKIRK